MEDRETENDIHFTPKFDGENGEKFEQEATTSQAEIDTEPEEGDDQVEVETSTDHADQEDKVIFHNSTIQG